MHVASDGRNVRGEAETIRETAAGYRPRRTVSYGKEPSRQRSEACPWTARWRIAQRSSEARGRGSDRPVESAESDGGELRLALAQLPARMREAAVLFRELTGFTAVTSFRSPVAEGHESAPISPPMHPTCASRLRETPAPPPCEEQWQKHFQAATQDRSAQHHVCPLGMRCSCIPIYYGDAFAGVAKCVAGRGVDVRRFSLAIRQLELAVSKASQEFRADTLAGQLVALREQIVQLQGIRQAARPAGEDLPAASSGATTRERPAGGGRPSSEPSTTSPDATWTEACLSRPSARAWE